MTRTSGVGRYTRLHERANEGTTSSVRSQSRATTLDYKNAAREQEVLKQLNDHLQAQITAFQRTQVQMQPENEPEIWETRIDGPITNLRQSRLTSLYAKILLTMKLICLISEREFSTARLEGGSRSSPTSETSTSWSKNGSKK